jgi:NitT/TauT family transport system substrate-binding protein
MSLPIPALSPPRSAAFARSVMTLSAVLLVVACSAPASPAPTSAPTAAKPAAGAAATSAPAATAPAAQQTTPLRVAFTPGHSTLVVHAALVNGYFKQNGLDVTLTEGQDLPTYIAALDKQFDISMTVGPIFLNAVAQGVPVKAVSGVQLTVSDPPSNPLLTKDPAINSVKDLAGKTVGVPALTGASVLSLQYLMQKNGVDPNSVKLIQVNFAEEADQLNAGRIDAALSAPPFYVPLLNGGFRNVVDVTPEATKQATGNPNAVSVNAFFVASDTFVSQHPDQYKAFRKSIQQGIDWMTSNQTDSRAMLAQWLQLTPEIAQASPQPVDASEVTAAQIQPWITIMQTTGALKGTVPDATTLVAP